MGAEDIQLNEQTPTPMHHCSGNKALPITNIEFYYNFANN